MASYKDIQGFNIQNLSSDPVPFAQEKANNPYAGTWASGGSLNTARTYSGASGLGTQTDSLLFGGRKNSAPASNKAETEKYNGTAWTELNDLPAAKEGVAGFGTTTNAVSAGGGNSPAVANPTCTWDGTSWTEVNEINTAREKPKGAGTYTAGLIFSGQPYPSVSAATEEWDGINWTNGGSLNTARTNVGNAGATQTAGLAFGGITAAASALTEEYNGTAWTEKADLNTARGELGGLGTSTLALAIGGYLGPAGNTAKTESFNGTVWTEVNDLGTIRNNGSGSGTGTLGLYAGGNAPNETGATEEWTFSGIPPTTPAAGYSDAIIGQIYYNTSTGSFKAIKDGGAPVGTWASGGAINTGRFYVGGAGTSTAALMFGGATPTPTGLTESYNGTSWTEVNDMNTGRQVYGVGASNLSALGAFGSIAPQTNVAENWNGTSWTNITSANTPKEVLVSFGIADLALFGTGTPVTTELWNGTSWTEVTEASNQHRSAGSGTTTAGLAISSPGTPVESYNGTSWTEVGDVNTGRNNAAASGIQTATLFFGGSNPPVPAIVAQTEYYDGTSWTEVNDLSTAVFINQGAQDGGVATAISMAGETIPGTLSTTPEEWTAADFTINTLTTS